MSRRAFGWPLLPWCVWLLIALGSLCSDLPARHGGFGPDPDNYLRADQVRDFMAGQGWFDTAQHRLDVPPAATSGGPDAFSRLVDLPLAAVAWAARPFTRSLEGAILAASVILPLFVLLPFALWLAGWAYRPLFGPLAWLASLLLCYPDVLAEFLPGRIDHHCYQILLVLAALGTVLRLERDGGDRARWHHGVVLGLCLGLSLVIGVEGLPWLGVILAAFYALLWRAPRRYAYAAGAFACVAALLPPVLLLALRTPAQYMMPTLYVFSLTSAQLAAGTALVFAAGAWAAPRIVRPGTRAVVLSGLAMIVLALLIADTPGLLRGPFLGFDPWLVAFTKARVGEMQPLARYRSLWPAFESAMVVMVAGCWFGWRHMSAHRAVLSWLIPVASLSGLGALFFASRLDRFWWIFAVPGFIYAALALGRVLRRALAASPQRPQVALRVAVMLALAPPIILLALRAITLPESNRTVRVVPDPGCALCRLGTALTARYPAPQRILANGTIGPQLVWGTPHTVIGGAIYNVAWGLQTADAVFTATDDRLAAELLQRDAIDLVIVQTRNLVVRGAGPASLQRRLEQAQPPAWLRPIALPVAGYALYEVDRAALENLLSVAANSAVKASTTVR